MNASTYTTIGTLLVSLLLPSLSVAQQTVQLDARDLQTRADVFFSPRSASFTQDSTFDVPIRIDTRGASINSMEIIVLFDPKKLVVVNPSGGKSIIGIWVEPPRFDNEKGTVTFVGTIPGGITTDSGLIATITFRARTSGSTALRFSSDSQVLLNDGYGTTVNTTFGRAEYSIVSKPPEGVTIYSETHPSDEWYNNNSPVLSWESVDSVDGYSYALDSSPLTIPENTVMTSDTRVGYQGINDGYSYFHLKARKNGVWGNTTHYTLRIDTTPPAEFTPHVDYLTLAAAAFRGMVSFKTTDALSGIDHYEVGTLALNDAASPVYIQSESPYQVPVSVEQMRVFVRAFDGAGNIRDASVTVDTSSLLALFIQNAWALAMTAVVIVLLAGIGVHYVLRHHIIRYLRDAYRLIRKERAEDALHEQQNT